MPRVTSVGQAALIVALLVATAKADFGCHKHWKGPSASNTFGDCQFQDTYRTRYSSVAPLIAPALVLVLSVLIFPLFWTCRQCCKCCGSNRRRPHVCCCGGSEWDSRTIEEKEREYTNVEVVRTKAATGVLWVLGMGCLFCMVAGASRFTDVYQRFFADAFGVVSWGEEQVANIRGEMTLQDGSFVAGFPQQALDDASAGVASVQGQLVDMKTTVDKYQRLVVYAALAIGIVPVLFLVIGALLASLDVRTFGPAFLACWYFLFVLVYAILGVALLVAGVLSSDLCDEIDLQLKGNPGFFQWYIVPKCEELIDFGSIESSVQQAELTNAVDSCQNLQNICSSTRTWSNADPRRIFVCSVTDPAVECDTALKVQAIVNATAGKAQQPAPMCLTVPDAECGVAKCAVECRNLVDRQRANQTVNALDGALRSLTAYTEYVQPLLDCDAVVDVALRPFRSCSKLVASFRLIGAGATGYAWVFAFGIIVMFRGQKRFFKRKAVVEDEEEKREAGQLDAANRSSAYLVPQAKASPTAPLTSPNEPTAETPPPAIAKSI